MRRVDVDKDVKDWVCGGEGLFVQAIILPIIREKLQNVRVVSRHFAVFSIGFSDYSLYVECPDWSNA